MACPYKGPIFRLFSENNSAIIQHISLAKVIKIVYFSFKMFIQHPDRRNIHLKLIFQQIYKIQTKVSCAVHISHIPSTYYNEY
jgi:hypothetical protein